MGGGDPRHAAGRTGCADGQGTAGGSAAAAGDAARFSFADLCDAPLGASDYLAIAASYPTIFIDRVPVLDQTRAIRRNVSSC